MKKPTESDLVRACLDLLRLRGVLAWRNNATGIYDPVRNRFRSFTGLRGTSDILGVLAPSGRLLAVEAKAARGQLTPDQEWFLERVAAAGGVAVVVRDVRELEAALEDCQ